MYGGYFDTKEEAEKYRDDHEHYVMVAEYIDCRKKWALVFQVKTCHQIQKESKLIGDETENENIKLWSRTTKHGISSYEL